MYSNLREGEKLECDTGGHALICPSLLVKLTDLEFDTHGCCGARTARTGVPNNERLSVLAYSEESVAGELLVAKSVPMLPALPALERVDRSQK